MPVERRGQVIALKSGQPATGGTRYSTGRRQPSRGGTSRMTRECQVRICERLGVQFPGPTRQFPGPTRLVTRVSPVQTALRNCTRDEGRSFEVGNQVLISSHRKLLLSKAMVANVAETSGLDSDRQG